MTGPRTFTAPIPGWHFLLAVVCFASILGSAVHAEDPLHRRIDDLIARKTPNYEKLAAPLASDSEFLRRVTLDLTGTIPNAREARDFLDDKSADKRVKLVDRLLASPGYARHMQRTFDVLLMRRLPTKNVSADKWDRFLQESFAKNRPWDEIVRDILSADGSDPAKRGPARFLLDRQGDVHEITRDVSRIFLGANMECAQCHDHPEIHDYKQADYYGISAYLIRSFMFTDKKSKVSYLAEKPVGEVSFESVFDVRDKKSKGPLSTMPHVFNGRKVTEPKLPKGQEYEVKPNKDSAGKPKFSRLELFPEAIAHGDNPRFARTAANRLWGHLMGRGLVHPMDFDHSANPPSHPELLDLLAKEFRSHKFDIKWLLREIALSNTYQRSSRGVDPAKPADEALFAQAILKPLSPTQLSFATVRALAPIPAVVATAAQETKPEEASPAGKTGTKNAKPSKQELAQQGKKRVRGRRGALPPPGLGLNDADPSVRQAVALEPRFVMLFGEKSGALPEGFDATVDQSLFLANDPTFLNLMIASNGNLTDRLLRLPQDQPQLLAEELYLSLFSRRPSAEEVQDVGRFIKGKTDSARILAIRDLIWAAMTSSEFRFCP